MDSGLNRLEDHMDKELSLVPFSFKYLPLLYEMLKTQQYLDMSHISMKTLPKIGYICLLGKNPIAAGFLRRVEGGYAQLDGLTSNATFGGLIRHQGLNKVVLALISDAKDLKLNGILGITKDSGVLSRAKDLGFTVVEESLITLRL